MSNHYAILKISAKESADFHDHALEDWTDYNDVRSVASCKNCGKKVYVNAKPTLNSIEISGEAVATHCKI